jgi:N6-adenosine-specific RNA methylase IME4
MKTYGAILLDPAWQFKVYSKDTGQGRSAESHYPTMSLEDMKALPVPDLMAKDCAVFMWATFPTLPEAIELGRAWGLQYKTCAFLWAKVNKRAGLWQAWRDPSTWFMGMGFWTRANTEPCLLFTKGSPRRKSRSVRQLVIDRIRDHSRKPDCVHERIMQLVDGDYCELFARHPRDGWDCYGFDIDGRDLRESLRGAAA